MEGTFAFWTPTWPRLCHQPGARAHPTGSLCEKRSLGTLQAGLSPAALAQKTETVPSWGRVAGSEAITEIPAKGKK